MSDRWGGIDGFPHYKCCEERSKKGVRLKSIRRKRHDIGGMENSGWIRGQEIQPSKGKFCIAKTLGGRKYRLDPDNVYEHVWNGADLILAP